MTAYRIRHSNAYGYQVAVVHSHHRLHLTPHGAFEQQLQVHELSIDSTVAVQHDLLDAFGNAERHVEISAPYQSLNIIAHSQVSVQRRLPVVEQDLQAWGSLIGPPVGIEQYRWDSPHVRRSHEARAYAAVSFPAGCSLCAGLLDFARRIHDDCTYDPVATDIATPVETVLRQRRGVCQDFAHLALAGLRSLGLAACYISGYIETVPPPGMARLRGADASHAWIACWHPQMGWIMVDPTNACLVGDRHVVVAQGRDFSDVSPVTGVIYGGGTQHLEVAVDVLPEREWGAHPWPQRLEQANSGI